MNRSKWNGTPEGERFERHTGMQDPSLVIWDEARIYAVTHGSRQTAVGAADAEPNAYEIGQYEIDMDTLPDLTQHSDPRAALVLDALLRISCPNDPPPMPSSPPPVPTAAPLTMLQTA